MDYCEKLKHYLDGIDENVDLIKEAIASIEGHFELIPENELLRFSRVDAIAYLALKSIVRCKDCKISKLEKVFKNVPDSKEKVRWCELIQRYVDDDWFCADGIKNNN